MDNKMNSPRPIANPFRKHISEVLPFNFNELSSSNKQNCISNAMKQIVIPQHERDLITKAQAKRERKYVTKTLTT